MVGVADLILDTEVGAIVIDHKVFPGNWRKALERVASHAGQLWAYGVAAATGKGFLGVFVHLSTLGAVVPVQFTVNASGRWAKP